MPREPQTPALLVPYGEDMLAATARHVIDGCDSALPLLQDVALLLPDLQQSTRLRRALITESNRRGHSALLGPRIDTIAGYLANLPLPAPAILPEDARELVLMDALRQHADLFGAADLWQLSRSMLALFDELNLQQRQLPRQLDEFQRMLSNAYGVGGASPAHLGREARIVHTLWHAWQEQLSAEHATDHHSWYLRALAESLAVIEPNQQLFLVAFTALRPAEASWVRALDERGQIGIILQGQAAEQGYHPDAPLHALLQQLNIQPHTSDNGDPRTSALNAAFDLQHGDLRQRAAALRALHPVSPLASTISVFAAADSEQEARAVDFQVRRWLLQGKRNIGIVTEDRRLARRVRALLERAGVALADSAGWALSTTSSATVIERWLQAVEEDFAHQPMMDLLKSPFMLPVDPDEAEIFKRAVYRLEQDIVLHENIPRGLDRYRRHLQYRQRRLGWPSSVSTAVTALLERLDHAAQPLLRLVSGGARSLDQFMDGLQESLIRLELLSALDADDAGTRIVQHLEQLRHAARHRPLSSDWLGFRTWLGAGLEHTHFRPPADDNRVTLLSLEQTELAHFDALVVAAAEREFLPGSPGISPYFNDAVRNELGLTGWREQLSIRLHHFRRLLQSAPQVVITRRREQDGEELLPSPWLEAIQTLHEQTYGNDLSDPELERWLRNPAAQVSAPDAAPMPAPSGNPHAPLPAARLPNTISAAAQQHLIDCPYQFFAADCLRLKPVDEIREALEKSDYGERVHRCLEAFHGGAPDLPGPFTASLNHANRDAAIALLEEISRAVFAQDLEDNFIHRGWLSRWTAMIPDYLDWQIARSNQWQPVQVERSIERPLAGPWRLKGRLDRMDRNSDQRLAVIDYKTGATPRPAEVNAGEAVQLLSYAMLCDEIDRVEYLQLDKQVRSVSPLAGDDLSQLRSAVRQRLIEMLEAIAAGAALPAWGDLGTCERCKMAGLCRRQTWDGPIQ